MQPLMMRVLGALAALLFAGGVAGLVTVSGDDDGESVDSTAGTTTTSSSLTTTSSPVTTTSTSTTAFVTSSSVTAAGGQSGTTASTASTTSTTSVGSGLATGGSATVQGSEAMADTGGEDLLLPGLALLALALGARRLHARSVD